MTAGAHSAVLEREASCIPGGILKHNNLFSMNNGEYLLIPLKFWKDDVKNHLFARLPSSLRGHYLDILYMAQRVQSNMQMSNCQFNNFLATISKFKMDSVSE